MPGRMRYVTLCILAAQPVVFSQCSMYALKVVSVDVNACIISRMQRVSSDPQLLRRAELVVRW
jgi:hypothetical protein